MKFIKYLFLGLFSVVLMNCGGNDKKKEKEGFTYEKKTDDTKEVEANPNDVVITGDDMMRFNKSEIKVKAGKKVKLTLRHIGKLDKQVMGHNWVLLKPGVDLMGFSAKAVTFKDNDYIPDGTEDVIAHTKLIGGGETAVVEFDAPAPGTYEFLCSFPGHAAMMRGTFVVEE
ncbi:azurin [Gaetbulibacter aestuarii]|uniref:Azurin n=1 Tax=Gaetbulibacter aestuarii TaxID=1502358 RepID=A0ABW7N0T0_9FLAO